LRREVRGNCCRPRPRRGKRSGEQSGKNGPPAEVQHIPLTTPRAIPELATLSLPGLARYPISCLLCCEGVDLAALLPEFGTGIAAKLFCPLDGQIVAVG
jgi:hypothetical protein